MKINPPWLNSNATQIICKILMDANYQAWFVGGCVRNTLLNAPVADFDIATDAHPNQVIKLAKTANLKVIPTGIDHGTVTVIAENTAFEITTFRKDVATDGRHAVVAFSKNMRDDALRRDFTINALYMDHTGEIADPLGGLADLQTRHIKFIEDADARIKEDYLRILRFFRFYAWYGNELDADGLAACAVNIDGLQKLSLERTTSELLKILNAPDSAPAIAAFAAIGGLTQILPGADTTALPVLIHIEEKNGFAPNPLRRLAILGGHPADMLRLSKQHTKYLEQAKAAIPHVEAAYRFGAQIGIDRLIIEAASIGQDIDTNMLKKVKNASTEIFPVKAADLMPSIQGPALGQAIKAAEQRWIASNFTLTKAELLRN